MRVIIILLTFFYASCTAQEENKIDINHKFSISELKSDLKLLKTELENKHPGLYTYTSKAKLDSVFEKINTTINSELSAIEFYRKIVILNSVIKDAHTKIVPPKGFRIARDNTLPGFPFTIHFESNKIFVLRNLSNNNKIKPGWEIVKINNELVIDIVSEILNSRSRDGYNKTGAISKINLYFSGFYANTRGCPKSFEIEFKDLQNHIKKINIKALIDKDIMSNKNKRYASVTKQTLKPISFQTKENLLILKVSSFEGSLVKKSGQSYKKEFKNIFKEIKNKKIKNLIIDLRENRGGWNEVGDPLLSYLIPTPYYHYKNDYSIINKFTNKKYYLKNGYIKHFEGLEFEKNKDSFNIIWNDELVKPKKNLFKGSIIILINGLSASQTGTFSGLLKDKTNAIFIGEETGGNPNEICGVDIVTLILPTSKVIVEIPLRKIIVDINYQSKGRGVIPDFKVSQSLDDKLNHNDAVLNYAIKLCSKN